MVRPDRAQRVLPLLFARPLTGVDYVLAKVGAIATIVFGFGFLPHVVLFVGQMLVSDGALEYLTDNAAVLWQVPVSVALLALYYAAIGVALPSLTDRRIVGGVAILGLALVTSTVAAIVTSAAGDDGSALDVLNVLPCRSASATWCSSATSGSTAGCRASTAAASRPSAGTWWRC